MTRLAISISISALFLACQPDAPDPVKPRPPEPSPNASILPAPLSSDLGGAKEPRDAGVVALDGGADAGSEPPSLVREDTPFETDPESRDLGGLSLRARLRWLDVPAPGRLPEQNADAVERAKNELAFEFAIDLAATGRMRLELSSDTFALPRGSELRARTEWLGHALIWPGAENYTVLTPGAARSALNERRTDVVPLSRPKPVSAAGGDLQGLPVERRQFTTPLGRLDLDQAHVAGSGFGGPLLCRLLLELAAVNPESSVCSAEMVPLRAEYGWSEGAKVAFEVTKWTRVASIEPERVLVPPPTASFRRGELPGPGRPLLVSGSELARFRLRPTPAAKSAVEQRRDLSSVKEGLLVENRGELAGYVLLDGAPVLRAEARGQDITLPLVAGTYQVSARDLLGTVNIAPSVVSVPGRFVLSEIADSDR